MDVCSLFHFGLPKRLIGLLCYRLLIPQFKEKNKKRQKFVVIYTPFMNNLSTIVDKTNYLEYQDFLLTNKGNGET